MRGQWPNDYGQQRMSTPPWLWRKPAIIGNSSEGVLSNHKQELVLASGFGNISSRAFRKRFARRLPSPRSSIKSALKFVGRGVLSCVYAAAVPWLSDTWYTITTELAFTADCYVAQSVAMVYL